MLDQVNLAQHQGIRVAAIHDRQHLKIKGKQQNLRTAIIKGTGMDQIIACGKELIAITLEHFKSEEIAMDANTLRSFSTHRRFHTEMIESLKVISSDLEHRRISAAIELLKLFDVRLTYHLDVEDAALGRELKNVKGIRVAAVHDRQHLTIKGKQQNLRTAIIKGTGMDQIIACGKELIAITLEHFKSEEIAMDANTLRSFSTHRRFHTEMIESLKVISSDLEHRRISAAIELLKLFDVRLTYHLDVEDAALGRELKNVKS